MSKAIIVCVCISISVTLFAACATGGSDGGGEHLDAAAGRQDASNVVTSDAATHADAGQDAQLSQIADAGGGSGSGSGSGSGGGLFCSQNSECTVSGECCVTLGGPSGFCAPGDVVFGACIPQ